MATAPLRILGVPLDLLTADDALASIEAIVDAGHPTLVAYANAHTLNLASELPGYRAALSHAGLVLPDGSGVAIAARVNGSAIPENLNGSDFNPRILALAARRGLPVFFLGGRPGVADAAARAMTAAIPGLDVVGTHHGYFPPSETDVVVDRIKGHGPVVLMVAMGNPKQELWITEHLAATGAVVGVGVGAFFDFAAGAVRRAPAWMNRAGVEWVYRLAQEPSRLWRRYVVGNPVFLTRLLRERLG